MTAKFRKALSVRLDAFSRNCRGVAAVEFAVLLPVLVLMTLGVAEGTRAIMAHKKFQKAVALIGDLVSREEIIGTDLPGAQLAMAGMMNSAKQAMYPYDPAQLSLAVSAISSNITTGAQTVAWAYKYNGYTATSCPGAKQMPDAAMLVPGNAAILVEAEYKYTPIISGLIPGFNGVMTFKEVMPYAPRGQCPNYAGHQCTTCP
jgi:Flp pilus assembly protein TadG